MDTFWVTRKVEAGFRKIGGHLRKVGRFIRKVSLGSRKIKGLIGYFLGYSQGRGWVSQDQGPVAQDRSLYSQGLSRFTQDQGLDWMLFGLLARSRLGFARSSRSRKIKGLIRYFCYSQGRGWVSQDWGPFAQGRSLYSQGPSRFAQDSRFVRTKNLSPRGKRFHVFVLAYFYPAVFDACYYCLGTVVYAHFLKDA